MAPNEMTSERYTQRRILWCLWGALLAAVPYTLRFSAVSSYEAPGLVAPLQCAVPAVAAATGTLAVIRLWNGRRLESLLERTLPCVAGPLAFITPLSITLCELGFLPMRLGNYALCDWELLFDAVSGCMQAVSFLAWALYGAFCVAGKEDPGDQPSGRQTAYATALGASALLPVLAVLASQTITSWPPLQVALCLLCGLLAGHACWRISGLDLLRGQLMLLELIVVGGIFCAAAFREASSELLFWLTWDNPYPGASLTFLRVLALFAAFATCVAGTSYFIGRGRKRSTKAPEPPSSIHGILEKLPQAVGLSERQRDVLSLAATGLSRREISQRLGISVGTVGTHLTRGLNHLGIASTEELVEVVAEKCGEKSQQRPSAKGELLVSLVQLVIIVLLFVVGLPDYTVGLNIGPLPFTYALAILFTLPSLARIATREGVDACHGNMSGPRAAIPCLLFAPLGMLAGNRCFSYILSVDLFIDMSLAPLLILCVSLVLAACLMTVIHHNAASNADATYIIHAPLFADGICQLFTRLPEALLLFGCGYGTYYLSYTHMINFQIIYITILTLQISLLYLVVKLLRTTRQKTLSASFFSNDMALDYLLSQGLSSTETQVALLISSGYTCVQISRKLIIGKGTVNSCRASAYRKLGVHSIAELKSTLDKHAGEMRRA